MVFLYRNKRRYLLYLSIFVSACSTTQLKEIAVTKEPTETNKLASTMGFTPIEPSTDSRHIYVSSSDGNDQNTCLSKASPCASIQSGLAKMRTGFPDHVYLKRGDIWRGENLKTMASGRSAEEPSILAFYGNSGKRPKIESDGELFRRTDSIDNIKIMGIEFYGYKMDAEHPEFTGEDADRSSLFFLGPASHIWIEDCKFHFNELLFQKYNGGHAKTVTIKRNIFIGSYSKNTSYNRDSRPSNLYISDVDGIVLDENVFDYGGWHPKVPGAGANMFNHNVYIQYSSIGNGIVFKNNIVVRGSNLGVHGRPGGLYENNFFARNSHALQMGYRDKPLRPGTFAIARNNVITEGENMVKGVAACSNRKLCTAANWGLFTDEHSVGRFQVHGNIIHSISPNKEWARLYNTLFRRGLNRHEAVDYKDNIIWAWDSDEQGKEKHYSDPGRTLADYNTHLGGEHDFDAFMNTVKNRPIQTWDDTYSASAINDYIRAGFDIDID